MPRYFSARTIYHNGQFCHDSSLAVDSKGFIIGLLPRSYATNAVEHIDFGERILCPGWVDLQVNGCGGGLLNRDLNLSCLEKMLRSSLRNGATSIQPTLITCSDHEILETIELVREAKHKAQSSKEDALLWQGIIGLHLEGPYISIARRGAHPERLIRSLDEHMLQKLEAAGTDGVLSYITIAAESVEPDQVARLASSGLTVAIGHSGAPIKDSRALLLAGARCFTHLYNGMGDINSRDPHTLSLALEDARAYSGIIADGLHVAPENVRIAQRLLGERLFLVTDATATEEDDANTVILFGEQPCYVQNGCVRNKEGSLAGSALTMKQGVQNLAKLFNLKTALAMASANPVRALNSQSPHNKHIGTFAPGSKANFVVLDYHEGIRSLETWILGQHWLE